MSNEFILEDLNIDEVIELVENGDLSVEDALEQEKEGKNRSTLVKQLESLLNDDSGDEKEDNELTEEQDIKEQSKQNHRVKKKKVTIQKNIKYNGKRYRSGEELQVDLKDLDSFIKQEIVRDA